MGISALLASQILDASATGRSVITGADASAIRTTLGLGTLATQSPTGTPSASTFLRGDFSWQTIDLSGYVPYSGATGAVNLGSNNLTISGELNLRRTLDNSLYVATQQANRIFYAGGDAFACHTNDGTTRLYNGGVLAWNSGSSASSGSIDLAILRDAAQTLGIRNSTNSQRLNLYGTYTDASNYRRLFLSSTTAGAFTIGVEGAGTGASGNTFAISSNATVPRLGIGGGTHDLSTFRLHVIDSDSGAVGFYVQNTNATGGGVPRIAVAYGGTSAFGVTAWQNRSYIEDQGGNGLALGADNANVYIYGNRGNWNTGITVTSGSRILIGQNTDDGSTRVQINGAIKAAAATFSGNVTVSAVNLVTDTTTGTKIGTATTQKLGFFDKTPVVQPTAVANATDAASVITQLNALLSRMRDLGLIAT